MASSKHSFRFGLSEILLIVFVLFSGIMLAFHSGGFVVNFQSLGFTVLSSMQKGVSAVAGGIGDTFNAVHELARLREENREKMLITHCARSIKTRRFMMPGFISIIEHETSTLPQMRPIYNLRRDKI